MAGLIGQRIDKHELVALLGGRVALGVALKLIDPRLLFLEWRLYFIAVQRGDPA
ncbi:MAG: hypothetical protein ACYDBJ_16630 [Aggregatilineales bacterium]